MSGESRGRPDFYSDINREPDLPEPGSTPRRVSRRLLLGAGGLGLAVGAGVVTWRGSRTPAEAKARNIDEEPTAGLNARAWLSPSEHYTPAGTRFSSEQNEFGQSVRELLAGGNRDFEQRYRSALQNGGRTECGVAYGIGEMTPIEYVRRHIYSASAGLPEWMRVELASAVPALFAVESGFSNASTTVSDRGAQSAAQYMPDQWTSINALLRAEGRLGAEEWLDPTKLHDLVVFVGAYFVDTYQHFERELRNRSADGIALAKVGRLFGYVHGLEPDTSENAAARDAFERQFVFPGMLNAYNSGAPFFLDAIRKFESEYLDANVEELKALAPNGHALYGRFLAVMEEIRLPQFYGTRGEQIHFTRLLFAMRERLDAARLPYVPPSRET